MILMLLFIIAATIFLIKMTINSKTNKQKNAGRRMVLSHSSTNFVTVWLERKQLVLTFASVAGLL